MGTTTIKVDSKTRDLLKKIGRKEQTYDDVINQLLKERRAQT